MITFTEILGCDGTALYQSDGQGVHFKASGQLQLLIAYDGMIMFRMDDFEYGVNASDEIIYDDQDPQYKMVLHLKRYPKGKWILKINQHMDEVYSCLNEKCYLKSKNQVKTQYSSYSASQEAKSEVKKPENIKKEQKQYYDLGEEEDEMQAKGRSSLTAGEVIVTASKGLGWGLAMTGKLLSKGFQAIGGVASKAVKPAAEKVQISENAKANIDLAKKTSKSVFTFTAKQVGNIFAFGKETVSNIGERFQKSEKGQEMQENPRYETVKSGASTGIKAFSHIYSGFVNGVYQMGSGISKGTSKIVGKKYGDEAGQAADDMFEGAGNIVKIARVPQDQAANAFKD